MEVQLNPFPFSWWSSHFSSQKPVGSPCSPSWSSPVARIITPVWSNVYTAMSYGAGADWWDGNNKTWLVFLQRYDVIILVHHTPESVTTWITDPKQTTFWTLLPFQWNGTDDGFYHYPIRCACVCVCVCVCVQSNFSPVWPFSTLRTVDRQEAPLSIEFSKLTNWSWLPRPPPGNQLGPGIEPVFVMSPALARQILYR